MQMGQLANTAPSRYAIFWACSDGMRGPVPGTATFDTEESAAREAKRLHAAKPFINYQAAPIAKAEA